MAHRPALGAGIAEADVLEGEAVADRRREGTRILRRDDLRLDLEEGEQVVEVERLPRHLREADQQPLQQGAQAEERAGQEGEVADAEAAAQRAPGDVGVGHVIAHRADGGQRAPPAGAADRQPAVALVEGIGELAVALDQEGVEAEDLHFLGGLDAGAGLAHVVDLAPLRRPHEVQRVALRVEVRLAEEGRDQRQDQQRDQPGGVDHQPGGEADDGHDVLRLAEELVHQRHPAGGLPAGALEPVLQLAVLEVLEVERRRVLHQAHAGGVGELLGEEGVEQRDQAAQPVGEHRQDELGRQQPAEVAEQAAGQPVPQVRGHPRRPGQPDHLVDDQLADIERGHRQQRPHQAQRQVGPGEAGAGPPDQLQEGGQVAQRPEALAQRPRRRGGVGNGVGCGRSCCSLVPSGSLRLPPQGLHRSLQGEPSPPVGAGRFSLGDRRPVGGGRSPPVGSRCPVRKKRLPLAGQRLPSAGDPPFSGGQRLPTERRTSGPLLGGGCPLRMAPPPR